MGMAYPGLPMDRRHADAVALVMRLQLPPPHWHGVSADAGALLSVGLLRQLDYGSFEACVRNASAAGLPQLDSEAVGLLLSCCISTVANAKAEGHISVQWLTQSKCGMV